MTHRTSLRLLRLAHAVFGAEALRPRPADEEVRLGAAWEYPRRARGLRARRHEPSGRRRPPAVRKLVWREEPHSLARPYPGPTNDIRRR